MPRLLLLSEATRPPEAWRAFSRPGVIIDGTYPTRALERLWVPSPLILGAEAPARLHFEVRPDGVLATGAL